MSNLTTTDIDNMLMARYEPRKYVKVPEAPSANAGGRYCDLLVFGVWESSGNEIIGHEVKASRSDWIKELQDPAKSEAFVRHCHRWYIVANKGIVKLEELQADWGLMEVVGAGLKIRRQATKKIPTPIPPNMMSAILRRVTEGGMAREIEKRVLDRIKAQENRPDWRLENLKRDFDRLKSAVSDFEKASGIRIDTYRCNTTMGDAVRYLLENKPDEIAERYRNIQRQLNELGVFAENAANVIEQCERV